MVRVLELHISQYRIAKRVIESLPIDKKVARLAGICKNIVKRSFYARNSDGISCLSVIDRQERFSNKPILDVKPSFSHPLISYFC